MRRMMGYENYQHHGGGIPHISPQNGLKVLTDYSLQEANEMLTSEKWTRAMFVRDPKERVLSAYCKCVMAVSSYKMIIMSVQIKSHSVHFVIQYNGGLAGPFRKKYWKRLRWGC